MRVLRFLGSSAVMLSLVTAACGGGGSGGAKSDAGAGGSGGSSATSGSGGGKAAGGRSAASGGRSSTATGGANHGGASSNDSGTETGGANGGKGGKGGQGVGGGGLPFDGGPEVSPDGAIVVPANDLCANATVVALSAATPHMNLRASTFGATHDVDAPCQADSGPDVFYELFFSRRVFLYADTFGASWNTVLFLLSNTCVPITTSTTTGDALCSDDACGTPQSRLVALLAPGRYRLGIGGSGGAKGAAIIHLEWTLAGNGAVKQLPSGDSVQTGTTAGSGNIDGRSSSCTAAAAEDSFWWANCPADPGGNLTASTCGGATWETVLETEIPQSQPFSCTLDTCGLQSSVTTAIPAGPGLRVLAIDGQGGGDLGAYTLTVTRP